MQIQLLTISLALSLSLSVFGQKSFGVKAGGNYASQEKNANRSSKSYLGYQIGGFYNMRVQKHLLLSAELNFNVIGSRMRIVTEDMITNPDGKDHFANNKMGYLELPLIAAYRLNNFYIGAGPAVAYQVLSKTTHFENRSHHGLPYKKLDLSANIASGYAFSKKITFAVRYSHGLKNLELPNVYSWYMKNRYFNASLLYSFNCH